MVDNLPDEVYDYVMNIKHFNVNFIGLMDYEPIKELMILLEYNLNYCHDERSCKSGLMSREKYPNLLNYLSKKTRFFYNISVRLQWYMDYLMKTNK